MNRTIPTSRIGLGAAYGLGARGVERAHERGVRFFLWGAIRHPGFGDGLRTLIKRDRSSLEIAIQSYAKHPWMLGPSVEWAMRKLGTDHIDTLCLGDWDSPPPEALIDAAHELRLRGKIRALIVSCHRRAGFAELLTLAPERRFDGWMVRYNAAHRDAETEVFTLPDRPRIIAYTATRWGTLLNPDYSRDEGPLTATECYRFALSSPAVDLCLAGPANESELDAALEANELGGFSELGEISERDELDETGAATLERVRRVGDLVHAHGRARPPPGPRDVIHEVPRMLRDLWRNGITENLVSRFNR